MHIGAGVAVARGDFIRKIRWEDRFGLLLLLFLYYYYYFISSAVLFFRSPFAYFLLALLFGSTY